MQDHTNNKHDILEYLKDHPVVILGTVNEHNQPCGAAVYTYTSTANEIYFITKSQTQKFKNLVHNPKVSITIADQSDNSTFQGHGDAQVVNDAQTIEMVMGNMTKIYAKSVDWLPPLTKIQAGPYEVVKVNLNYSRLAKYKNKPVGSKDIFKEVQE